MTLKTLLGFKPEMLKKILTEEEHVNYAYELLEIAVTKYSEEQNGGLIFNDEVKHHVDKCTSALEHMCKTQHVQIAFLAKLKLAHFHLLFGKYEEAAILYDSLQTQTSSVKRENVEVMRGLFKCHLGQKNYKDADRMVAEIRAKEQVFYYIEELYAEIYFTRAKQLLLQLGQSTKPCEIFCKDPNEATNAHSKDMLQDDHPYAITHLLEKAIEMGSLEACFMFFKLEILQDHFLRFVQIPRIVARIERVNKEEIVNTHTNFKMENYVDDLANSTTAKRNFIKEKIEKLLTYHEIYEEHGKHFLRGEYFEGLNAYQKFTVINVYTKLSKMRKYLLNFEVVENRKDEKVAWNDDCEEAVTTVLLTARFLLDHIVSDYQDTLISEGEKPNSDFCIHYNGSIDRQGASTKLHGWLICRFPGCHEEIPKKITEMLLEIQPMCDEDNLWLIALNTFVNALKHGGGRGKQNKPTTTKKSKLEQSDLQKNENKENLATGVHEVDKSVRRKDKKRSTKTKKNR